MREFSSDLLSDGQRYLCNLFIHYFHRNRVLVGSSLDISKFLSDHILMMRLKRLVNQNREVVKFSLFLVI